MELPTFEARLVVGRHNRWLLGTSVGAGVLGLVLLLLTRAGLFSGDVPNVGSALVILSLVGALSVLRKNPAPVLRESLVQIEPGVLRIDGEAMPRSSIRDAQLVPGKDGTVNVVRVWRARNLPLDLMVRDKAQGREVLRALGFDASQIVTRFRGASLVMTNWSVRSGLVFVLIPLLFVFVQMFLRESPEIFALGTKALMVILPAIALLMAIPSRIAVGADGVLLRWLGMKWFHPLSKVRKVERYSWGMGGRSQSVGVAMTMDGGHVARIPMGSERWNEDRAAALAERIAEAMETHARGGVDAAAMLLGRRERGVREWIQELRAIGAGANVDLRTAAVNPENLWRIVESHGAQAEERAAAAVALGPSLDAEGKQRLRVAVDAVADERLRVAIDAAVEEDEGALEEALEGVSGEERNGAAKAGG